MLVQRVLSPASSLESWTVLGDDDLPVAAIERYLAYLTDIERSPNTVKAYAHDLKDYFTFLDGCGLDWREVRLEDIGEFVAWLRLPPAGRDGRVAILPSVEHHVSASTVNRKLSALSAFYLHAARNGVDLGELLITWGPAGRRGGWKPFLHHISKGQPAARRTIALKASRKLPRILTADEVQTILDACGRLRDRLLFAVLYDTGMRIGEALGLRHEDIAAAEREVTVFPRHNANGARTKSANTRTIPVSAELVRLYADYLHEEYGDLDSDYVFVNLWGRPHGRPLAYPAVYDLVCRLRGQTGIDFGPHWYRHTFGTGMINRDVPQEVVRRILDHDSSQMTGHYARLHDTTVRRHWEAARKVSITGQTVTLDPNGPLAEAAWAKQRLGRATQALPNGFCGLPVQKTCPHANACLTCPMFITTPEFLPQHRDHRQQIIQIISAAQARGQTRLAEMNQQVLANLDNIITGLQDDTGPGEVTADAS